MGIFKGNRASQRSEQELFRNNKEDVTTLNSKVLVAISGVLTLVFLILIVIAMIVPSYHMMLIPYVVITALLGLMFFISKMFKGVQPVFLLYTVFIMLFAYSITTSCFVISNEICVTVVLVIMMMPIFILDKSARVNATVICLTGIYLIPVMIFKSELLALDELVDTIIVLLIGLILGGFFRQMRLENFELRRLGDLREMIDQLTGLFSRRKLFNTFKEAENINSEQRYYAAAMIDVDHFKSYNDTYGHQVGDKCLEEIGRCFRKAAKKYPVTFYRYGGEEFAVLFERDGKTDPFSICRELNENVSSLRIENGDNEVGRVTISIGLTFIGIDEETKFERWIYQADSALYSAKAKGRNRTVIYEDDGRQIRMSFRTR